MAGKRASQNRPKPTTIKEDVNNLWRSVRGAAGIGKSTREAIAKETGVVGKSFGTKPKKGK